jgi:hypothetical protein
MPGAILNQGSIVQCAHAAPAQPTPSPQRVSILSQPVVTLATVYVISGCTNNSAPPNPVQAPPAPPPPYPCASASFTSAAKRVTTMGVPLLLLDSQALCTPTGREARPVQAQPRVQGI